MEIVWALLLASELIHKCLKQIRGAKAVAWGSVSCRFLFVRSSSSLLEPYVYSLFNLIAATEVIYMAGSAFVISSRLIIMHRTQHEKTPSRIINPLL